MRTLVILSLLAACIPGASVAAVYLRTDGTTQAIRYTTALGGGPHPFSSTEYLNAGDQIAAADLYGADLAYADLYVVTMPAADLRYSFLGGAMLSGAVLYSSMMMNSDLTAARMVGADLRFVDLSSATLYFADMNSARLSESILANTDLSYADLRYADLANANLAGANLTAAVLFHTLLNGADLRGADLSSSVVVLNGGNVFDSIYDESTIFPSGFDIYSGAWGLPSDSTPWDLRMIPSPEPHPGLMLAVGVLAIAQTTNRRSARVSG